MNALWLIPLLGQIGSEAKEKLHALSKFSNHSEIDLVGIILEGGILDAWEGYRRNPKHQKQIEDYEKRRNDRRAGRRAGQL